MIRYFLLINNIDKINLCVTGMEIYSHYLTLYIGQEHFNVLKSVFCIENSAVDQVMKLNKSMMS